jgi:hypothetical protein
MSRSEKPEPVLWWALINEMRAFTARTGWGLAETWRLVRAGDYDATREHFDALQGANVKPGA